VCWHRMMWKRCISRLIASRTGVGVLWVDEVHSVTGGDERCDPPRDPNLLIECHSPECCPAGLP
jgi:hypothetical protein